MYSRTRVFRRFCHVRVRFAPSPTGQLHLGGLRTALYNYLYAKKHNGTFILRIEDTDQTRLVPGAASKLEATLNWIGLTPDESPEMGGNYGPYFQSRRLDLYRQKSLELIENGSAYRCFCSERRLELMKKEANRNRLPNRYDRRCLELSPKEIREKIESRSPYTVRFKLRPTTDGFADLIYGDTVHDVYGAEGDPIILKSDGYPTYHFANVVDDHAMGITHVLRGVEWQVSTPKHILMYEAFGWKPPIFGHLPLIVNADGTKLSKRQNDIHVEYYKDSGYFPQSIINFIATVGGGFDGRDESGQTLYTLNDFFRMFDPKKISTNSGRIESDKLNLTNRLLIKEKLRHDRQHILELSKKSIVNLSPNLSDDEILNHLDWASDRIHTLKDLNSSEISFLWNEPDNYHSQIDDLNPEVLNQVSQIISNSNSNSLFDELKTLSSNTDIKFKVLMKNLRLILIGSPKGPPIKEIVDILGSHNAVKRLNKAIIYLNNK